MCFSVFYFRIEGSHKGRKKLLAGQYFKMLLSLRTQYVKNIMTKTLLTTWVSYCYVGPLYNYEFSIVS